VWDHPFLWGSNRTGPDLARVVCRYSHDLHRVPPHNPLNVLLLLQMLPYPPLVTITFIIPVSANHLTVLPTPAVSYTDDAIAGGASSEVSLGVSLTAEQVAALARDSVWMERRTVNNQQVLVPGLYLAQANNRLAPNGALIQG
ncbi:hypothetical protein B1218_36415, partial [Pseudomonas ogarae]